MNTDETQIQTGTKDDSLRSVAQQRIGAAFEVHNVPGYGFPERVCHKAMQVGLESRGIRVELEPKIKVINLGRERVGYKRMVF
jgi:hypothetical protein